MGTSGFSPKSKLERLQPSRVGLPWKGPQGLSQAAKQVEKQEKGPNLAPVLGLLGEYVSVVPRNGLSYWLLLY